MGMVKLTKKEKQSVIDLAESIFVEALEDLFRLLPPDMRKTRIETLYKQFWTIQNIKMALDTPKKRIKLRQSK
jgi:hypothetical protein